MAESPYLPSPEFARWRKRKSHLVTGVLVACALAVIAPLFLVIYFLLVHGASYISQRFESMATVFYLGACL